MKVPKTPGNRPAPIIRPGSQARNYLQEAFPRASWAAVITGAMLWFGSFTALLQAAPYRATVLADGPSGYWRLGETGGPSAATETGLAVGGYSPAVAEFGLPGAIGGDANTAVRVTTGSPKGVEIPAIPIAQVFTLEMWIKFGTAPPVGTIIASTRTVNGFLLHVSDAAPTLRWVVYDRNSNAHEVATFGPANLTGWHHLVLTTDSYSGGSIYFDGELKSSANGGALRSAAVSIPVQFGADYPYNPSIDVHLDELAIYPTILTAAQVKAHFDAAQSVGPLLLPGVAVHSVSSEFNSSGWNLAAAHCLDGSGLSGSPALHAQNNFSAQNSWQTSSQTGTADIQFDLGSIVRLNHLHLWNLNFYAPYNGRGARLVRISTSDDATAWTTAVAQTEFPMATGLDGDPGFQLCADTWPAARYVRFEILSNWGGSDNAGHVGLSEIRFYTANPDARPFAIHRIEHLPATGGIALTFPAASGLRYSIETSENLTSWDPVGATFIEVPTDDAALRVTLPFPAVKTRCYFRVRTCLAR